MKVPHEAGPLHRLPELLVRGHRFLVPLDSSRRGGETLLVFAREVRSRENGDKELPWLLFLQGGPGYEAPRPSDMSGWMGRALRDHHILLLDQRGTGLSSALDAAAVLARGAPVAQADYLSHFRADGIVRDCEAIRQTLLDGRPWKILGQSFGGFCALHYLSSAPEGLTAAFITGGIPSLDATAEDVYRATYPILAQKHAHWFARYPEDEQRLLSLYEGLGHGEVRLTDGDLLTPERFSLVGLQLGMSDGIDAIHHLLEQAEPSAGGPSGRAFLRAYERTVLHDHHPIFSVLHEACYTQGAASAWAAARVAREQKGFPGGPGTLSFLNGEMIHPFMFAEISALAPLAKAAEILAEKSDWPELYDATALAACEVPCAAAVYTADMYVPHSLSQQTLKRVPTIRAWETGDYEHNGLRADGARVLTRLFGLLEETVRS